MVSKKIYEIRFHGRAGQGAKSAAALLAEAALSMGKQMQAFPEYGPERGGAPMKAYVRISDYRIFTYAPILHPDAVVVLDDTLLDKTVAQGLKGIMIVNTSMPKESVARLTGFKGRIYTLDATGISFDLLGKNFPNMPVLGALIKISKIVDLRFVTERIKKHFASKIGEEVAKKNVAACRKGYEAVK